MPTLLCLCFFKMILFSIRNYLKLFFRVFHPGNSWQSLFPMDFTQTIVKIVYFQGLYCALLCKLVLHRTYCKLWLELKWHSRLVCYGLLCSTSHWLNLWSCFWFTYQVRALQVMISLILFVSDFLMLGIYNWYLLGDWKSRCSFGHIFLLFPVKIAAGNSWPLTTAP